MSIIALPQGLGTILTLMEGGLRLAGPNSYWKLAGMNAILATLFQRLRAAGFSARQAAACWNEIHVLASPILFSLSALRATPRMRAVAAAHALLSKDVLEIATPAQWAEYCAQMPVRLHEVQERVCARWPDCHGILRDYWPVLAMDEGAEDYVRRTTIGHELTSEVAVSDWDELLARVEHRHALEVLCDQVLLPPHPMRRSWQRVLSMTGLRSVRWSYGDEPGDARHQARLMEALLHAQRLLRDGVGWQGPVLGLAGHTSLALTDRGKSDGMVQPDPGGQGQTMTLGHWSVLAHEWAHALDIMLARHFGCSKVWATHAALAWHNEHDPPEQLMVWFWQMGRVLGAAPPSHLLDEIRVELAQWEDRILSSLGKSLAVQEEVARQRVRLAQGTWTQRDAEEGWVRVSEEGDAPHLTRRTAHLLSCDVDFVNRVARGQALGYWSEYIAHVRQGLLSTQGVDDLIPGETSWTSWAPSSERSSLRYLTNSVEVMARSFEASVASSRSPDAVWLPPALRPNAGLLWPTAPEARFQGESWRHVLRALRPLWAQWKATSKLHTPPPQRGGE